MLIKSKSRFGANIEAFVESPRIIRPRFLIESIWDVEHWRDGKLLSKTRDHNFCTDQGLDRLLNVMFGAEAKITPWYVLIFNGASPTTGSTYAVPIYTELSDYDEALRIEYTDVPSSGQSITNSAAKAVFTISGTVTVDGAALVGATAGNITTIGDTAATNGTLYCASDFGSAKACVDNDVLNITITLTAADV